MESWITLVVNDGSVPWAIVLAEGLRRVGTSRKISVLIGEAITKENRVLLGKAFDFVFSIDQQYKSVGSESIQGILHAFSLAFFEKCVLLKPQTLMTENADKLFEMEVGIGQFHGDMDTQIPLLVFEPSLIWEKFQAGILSNENEISLDFILSWLKTEFTPNKILMKENSIGKFSLDTGILVLGEMFPQVVQFFGTEEISVTPERLKFICETNSGLLEKTICTNWLETYCQAVDAILSPGVNSARTSNKNQKTYKYEPIAIIGMSCRFPGANSEEEFGNMLYKGEEGIQEPPSFRWTKEHTLSVTNLEKQTKAGFLSISVDEFDSKFFGVSPKEAVYMDPQSRLLHEVLWESLEDGGIDPTTLYGTHTGIFTGSWMTDYKEIVQGSIDKDFFRTYMGNSIGAAVARLSHFLGVTGPSIATESGCSSAIVALDLAVKSLRLKETNLALVGGVNLLLHPFTSDIMDYIISPDGRCKTFDASADGFGRAEGCGVLVLKRLSDAIRDRDNIRAVIRGSAVCQEGLSKSLGTPTINTEALAMQRALRDGNIQPEQVTFVETHGTGTKVGDPLEVAAIAKAYNTPKRVNPLILGSVKTNVGHTESCSGITGIMKTILAMEHQLIPKHLNFVSLNPEIFLEMVPAIIPLENVAWPRIKGQSRIAGVSSLGITGTDGHIILEEKPDHIFPKFHLGLERTKHLLKISAKSEKALHKLLQKYQNILSNKSLDFANIAFTANIGRANFQYRAFLIADNCENAAKILENGTFSQGESEDGQCQQICFLFTGQGSQYTGMGKILYETSPVFRINFDICDRILQNKYKISIKKALWEDIDSSNELSRTIYSQTAIFSIEYCLLKLWQSWGIKPTYVLGHSLGEFCAAVAADLMDLKDALKLVAERSLLIDNLPRGKMLVIKADRKRVDEILSKNEISVDIAAENTHEQTVIAGDSDTTENLNSILEKEYIKSVILDATHAFHSRYMDSMLENYRKIAEDIKYKTGNIQVEFMSGLEGKFVKKIGPNYWVRHCREKVAFTNACNAICTTGCTNFLEIGPNPVLSSFVARNIENIQLNLFPSLRRGADDWETMLTSLGRLYLAGYNINWKGYDELYLREKTHNLPFYPFDRKSYWVEETEQNAPSIHPLLGNRISNAGNNQIFQNNLSWKHISYLKDHCIGDRVIFPGAGYTEMCIAAGYCIAYGITENFELPRRPIQIKNLRIEAPLELQERRRTLIQTIVSSPKANQDSSVDRQAYEFDIKIFHQSGVHDNEARKWVLHASAMFSPMIFKDKFISKFDHFGMKKAICLKASSIDPFYKKFHDAGLVFGNAFKMIRRYWKVDGEDGVGVVTEIKVPDDHYQYILHPIIIDAVFQSVILTTNWEKDFKCKVPISIEKFTLISGIDIKEKVGSLLYLHAWMDNGKHMVTISTEKYIPIVVAEGIEIIDANVRTIHSILENQICHLPEAWEEIWKPLPSPIKHAVKLDSLCSTIFNGNIENEINTLGKITDEDLDFYLKSNRLLFLFILNALYELGWKPKLQEIFQTKELCLELGILQKYEKLVHFYFTVLSEEGNIFIKEENLDTWKILRYPPNHMDVKSEMETLFEILDKTKDSAVVKIYQNISTKLKGILEGKISALAVLFPSDENQMEFSAERFYQVYPGLKYSTDVIGKVCKSLYQHIYATNSEDEKSVYRILEVGSGTGILSSRLLDILSECWGQRFEFYYTDISKSFFAKAETKFGRFQENMKYSIFNIEDSPLSQGIPVNYFDMVTAIDVLHATRNLDECLENLRQTLRVGGVLCLSETIVPARDITFVFGLLEGYYRFEDFENRSHHCCVGESTWETILGRCGYESVRSFKSYMDQFACITAIASQTANQNNPKLQNPNRKEWIIFSSKLCHEIMLRLVNILISNNIHVVLVQNHTDHVNFEHITSWQQNVTFKICQPEIKDSADIESILEASSNLEGIIFAWGMNNFVTDQTLISRPFLQLAKGLLKLQKSPKLYILTNNLVPVLPDNITSNPTSATLIGMVKSLKNENPHLFVRCIDVEHNLSPSLVVNQIMYEITSCNLLHESQRLQVVYRNKVRYEPRLCKKSLKAEYETLKPPVGTDRFHMLLPKSKLIQDIKFEALNNEEIRDHDVEVKVKAYALNFRDVLAVLKPSLEFENINAVGKDFSGVVTRVGKMAKFKIGDKVFGLNFKETQLFSHLVLDDDTVLKIPEMTFEEAATIPVVFSTAYYCLINVAKLKKNDTVLIHTGSGGVGLAAIQLAKYIGANIISTAGSKVKRAFLHSIGIKHVFHSRNTSYEAEILKATNGSGVDVVLNSLTGPGFKEATLRTCAKSARFVEMSKLSIWTAEDVNNLRPDVKYDIVDLTTIDRQKYLNVFQDLNKLFEKHILKPIPYNRFDSVYIRQAFQYFLAAKHIGKVVCCMPDSNSTDGVLQLKTPLFNDKSTYLITGGLGGIGFAVCKWMIEEGAVNIVLNGRRSPQQNIQHEINELKNKGNNILIKLGDVGDFNQCKNIIDDIHKTGIPLRGVMHCAGVLRDDFYPNLEWNSFEETFTPKVSGTWNLHKLTCDLQLEHFVLFSSIAALFGTMGQSTHVAANCFEDAFINFRHSLGLNGASINWGQWAQVGCATEVNLPGLLPVSTKRMLNGLDIVLRTQLRQIGFADFHDIHKLSIVCPSLGGYVDEKVWRQRENATRDAQVPTKDEFWKEMKNAEAVDGKISIFSKHFKSILRTALRLDPNERLSDDANIRELGVDSLMVMEIRNSTQSLLGSRILISTSLFQNFNTVRLISNEVIRILMDGSSTTVAEIHPLNSTELYQLLASDSALPASIQPASITATKPSNIRSVLVTGVRGELAPYILRELAKTSVKKFYCLVRENENITEISGNISDDFSENIKVDFNQFEYISGDVTSNNLGLSVEKYTWLSENVDAVIHCGIKRDYSESYMDTVDKTSSDIRSVNVIGTHNILKFASTTKTKHVFYPSSFLGSYLGSDENGLLSDCWPEEYYLKKIVDLKLSSMDMSKIVCELLLKQANERGIPCKIFRITALSGESETGWLNALKNINILRYLSYLKVNAIPALDFPANFIPIDKFAEFSIKTFLDDDVSCGIFNFAHPNPQKELEFVKVAREEFGRKLEIVSFDEFKTRVENLQMESDYLKKMFLQQALMARQLADAWNILKNNIASDNMPFKNQKVTKFIPKFVENIPSSMEMIMRDLKYFRSTNATDDLKVF